MGLDADIDTNREIHEDSPQRHICGRLYMRLRTASRLHSTNICLFCLFKPAVTIVLFPFQIKLDGNEKESSTQPKSVVTLKYYTRVIFLSIH